ncbi:hypothetical protein A3E49_03265 [Candidatus Saccharibacteria bacterium RIFCSPHIGHO2_12_FULL_49_19]|nr:MAG: hypothetical protein A2708_01565 [Candidatus Saccharibacteria bacterium RIFCSPHIGHO2_01_FULL_49_21]OGL36936.1 MAG: hypothetical protein A3E49_03265 [Candidatus Saccharibacteria bacterium RIFCSPHIGHO2_12_FULL_49_19]OGL37750.1 MAG: hypothetical protein A3B63_00145 [Candidatus Saccharibacteria bacterium RIFCSPLOWO2_01_FULL_49_22]
MLTTAVLLFILGLCAGSFVNALVWRVRQQSKGRKGVSILTGRSVCPKCKHELSARDLVPLLSWLALDGRCRYCGKAISKQYPVIELSAGLVFASSYLLWPIEFSANGQLVLFITWLLVSVGLLALLVYDFKWMLLPNRILYPTALIAAAGRLIYIAGFEPDKLSAVFEWGLAIGVASGIFWLLFMASSGKWIGYGDVRLGLITGTVLGAPQYAFLMIFTASLLGTAFVLPAILSGRKMMASKIPFGPFLIAATGLVLLFGKSIIDWYKNVLV